MGRFSAGWTVAVFYQDQGEMRDSCLDLGEIGDPVEYLKNAQQFESALGDEAPFLLCLVPPALGVEPDEEEDGLEVHLDEEGVESLLGQPAPDLLTLRNREEARTSFRKLGGEQIFGGDEP